MTAPPSNLPLSAAILYERFHEPRVRKRKVAFWTTSSRLPERPHVQPFPTIRALSSAPFVSSYTNDASFLSCAEEFFEDNPLIAATLQPATQLKYAVALEKFRTSRIANECSELSLDQRVSIYIQERYIADERPGQRQEMSNLICMLTLMYPSLRTELGLARRCVSGWKALKPSRSSAPFTQELVMALAWSMFQNGHVSAATTLMVSFSACLRVSEALNLTWNCIALPGDLRLAPYPQGTAGMNIRDAKTARYTGKLQFVRINHHCTIRLLTELKKQAASPDAKLAQLSYPKYAEALEKAIACFGLSEVPFTSHSARIGKATEDFIKGIPVEQIALHGRWKSLNSLRYYVNNGRAWILNTPMSTQNQSAITQAANRLKEVLRV